jgi:hypothetical protein
MKLRFLFRILVVLGFLTIPQISCERGVSQELNDRELTYERSWFGNTFSGWDRWENNGVHINLKDIFVTQDNIIYTVTRWGENTPGLVAWDRDGNMLQSITANGWRGTVAVVADDSYIYSDFEEDIRKIGRNDFDLGKNSNLTALATAANVGEVNSLALIEDELFAAIEGEGIVVFSARDLTRKRKLNIVDPFKIASDRNGNLWVLTGRSDAGGIPNSYDLGATRVEAYTKQGEKILEFNLPQGVVGSDIHADLYQTSRLFITDVGSREQVLVYDINSTNPKLVGTFGQAGGVFAGSIAGIVKPQRFFSANAVATDAFGNLFVNSRTGSWDGNTRFEKYSSSGQLQWRRIALSFVDSASANPKNDRDMYLKTSRVLIDYDRPKGEQDTFWRYYAHTMNPHKYPDDPRWFANLVWPEHKPTRTQVFYANGQKFLFVTTQSGGKTFAIFRFNPKTDGEIAIPAVFYSAEPLKETKSGRDFPRDQPRKGAYLWVDLNGDGQIASNEYQTNVDAALYRQTIDNKGNIWAVNRNTTNSISLLQLQGISDKGVPMYDLNSKLSTYSMPTDIDVISSATYMAETDTMLIAGNDPACLFFGLGFSEVINIPQWSEGNRKPSFKIDLPNACGGGHNKAIPIAMDTVGQYIFVGYYNSMPGSSVEQNGHVRVHKVSDGSFVGYMEHFNYLKGDIDVFNGMQVTMKKDGTYVVIVEEAMRPKQIIYEWKPEDNIAD